MKPTKVIIDNIEYPINTDFRVAIRCNHVASNLSIGDYERALAIIYILFGEKGLNNEFHHNKLIELGKKYLACGKEIQNSSNEEPDMDYEEDYDYICASFMSDYHIDLENTKMHWWTFSNLINGLSNSEMGNCCILNRIRNLRNYDLKDIKDPKEREKIRKAKESVSLKKIVKEKNFTKKQKHNIDEFKKMAGIG